MKTIMGTLVRRLSDHVKRRRRKPVRRETLEDLGRLWKTFIAAKKSTVMQWADDTMAAERVLHEASRNGFLELCVAEGLLPPEALPFTVPQGSAYVGRYTEVKESTGGKRVMISAAIEVDRRRH